MPCLNSNQCPQCHIAFQRLSPIKSRTCSARLGPPNFNFSPPPNQKELPTALKSRMSSLISKLTIVPAQCFVNIHSLNMSALRSTFDNIFIKPTYVNLPSNPPRNYQTVKRRSQFRPIMFCGKKYHSNIKSISVHNREIFYK